MNNISAWKEASIPSCQSVIGRNSAQQSKVAVVIPSYNHEQFVDEAISSVVAQSWTHWEMVIVDDGSSDSTRQRCEAWETLDPRIRLLSQSNAGSHAAINRGVATSVAPVIMVLNSDDRWDSDRVRRIMQEFEDPDVSFVVTGTRLIDASGAAIEDEGHWWIKTQNDFLDGVRRWGNLHGLLYGNYTVSTSNFAFRRSLWEAVGPIRPRKLIPDWDWALRAALYNPAGLRFLSGDPLLHYRLHGNNTVLLRVLRGALEINRLHHWALRKLGLPPSVCLSLFRNQRDLRRHCRRLGSEAAGIAIHQQSEELERLQTSVRDTADFVRAREADVAALQERLQQTEAFVRAREADVAALQERLQQTEAFVRAREADVAALQERLQQTEAFVRAREADVAALRERLTRVEASWWHRAMSLFYPGESRNRQG